MAGEIHELLGDSADDVIRMSAKSGLGVTDVLEAIVKQIPAPEGDPDAPARALIFDSEFDQYRGVVAYVRVVDGELTKGDAIKAMQTGTQAEIDDIGFFGPAMTPVASLKAGEVGYLITGIKDVSHLRVGDTLTTRANPAEEPLPGYREVKPMVFCGLFPVETDRFRTCATRWRSSRSTTPRSRRTPRPARRSASASAAASSACCTWTSCASASNANTTSSCWPPPPRSSTP